MPLPMRWKSSPNQAMISAEVFVGDGTWRIIPISKWLGPSPFTNHEWPFGRGPTTLLKGHLGSPWLLATY